MNPQHAVILTAYRGDPAPESRLLHPAAPYMHHALTRLAEFSIGGDPQADAGIGKILTDLARSFFEAGYNAGARQGLPRRAYLMPFADAGRFATFLEAERIGSASVVQVGDPVTDLLDHAEQCAARRAAA